MSINFDTYYYILLPILYLKQLLCFRCNPMMLIYYDSSFLMNLIGILHNYYIWYIICHLMFMHFGHLNNWWLPKDFVCLHCFALTFCIKYGYLKFNQSKESMLLNFQERSKWLIWEFPLCFFPFNKALSNKHDKSKTISRNNLKW